MKPLNIHSENKLSCDSILWTTLRIFYEIESDEFAPSNKIKTGRKKTMAGGLNGLIFIEIVDEYTIAAIFCFDF